MAELIDEETAPAPSPGIQQDGTAHRFVTSTDMAYVRAEEEEA
jgi:hypothetical protein